MKAYQINGIPQAFVIDGTGKIAGHGSLGHVLAVARDLAAENAAK
jgi:hypothetical protein